MVGAPSFRRDFTPLGRVLSTSFFCPATDRCTKNDTIEAANLCLTPVFTRGGTYWIGYFHASSCCDHDALLLSWVLESPRRVGNAYRCGVPAERVDHAGKVVRHLIVSASYDSTEEATADARFVEIFIASAVPDPEDALIPPCAAVVAQFERLERHHRQSGMN
jgi:hypothetical protein